ncbi:MAG: hypothetical protein WC679_02325 [Bacteroidales bacterium]|jgi:hypothetical protein
MRLHKIASSNDYLPLHLIIDEPSNLYVDSNGQCYESTKSSRQESDDFDVSPFIKTLTIINYIQSGFFNVGGLEISTRWENIKK